MIRIFTPLLLVLALALTPGCTSPEHTTGSATFTVSMPQGLDASVARVTVVASADDFSPLSLNLTQTGGVWSGTLDNIPAGALRSFRAQAFDGADILRFEGSVSGITITTNQTTLVSLLLQQVTPPPPRQEEPPVIDSLVASTTTVVIGNSVSLSVTARDANPGDTLTYAWSATGGTFSATSSATTSWTTPASAGIQTLTVTVTDTTGLSSSASVAINVVRGEELGSARLSIGFNRSPTVDALGLSPTRVAVAEPTLVSATVSDLDGDTLAYVWSASCAGTWSSTTTRTAYFTPSALPGAACNNCRLTVSVADGRGLSTTGSVNLCVSNAPRINHFNPRIVNSYQSSTTVAAGGTVSFEVIASDPENTALTFAWSANTGTLGTPTTSATNSRLTWTAPACAVTGTPTTVRSTVTNVFSLAAGKDFSLTGLPTCASGWSTTGSPVSTRSNPTPLVLPNGRVLISGGYTSSSYLTAAELYDPSTGTWSATGSMAVGRNEHTATLLPNGKVLVTGGSSNFGSFSSAELYDPAAGSWSATGSMSMTRSEHTATLLPNGKVLVVGGGSSPTTSTELYDPAAGTWSATGALGLTRGNHTATLLPNGKVLVAGGNDSPATELYDPATGTWSPTGPLTTARKYHAATALPGGKVLVSGGYSNAGGTLASAELYDSVTGAWSAAGNLTVTRAEHDMLLLPSGKVFAVAGYNGSIQGSAELYDPATRTWSSAGSPPTPRRNPAVALLPNGRLLLACGYNGSNHTRVAELYTP